MKKSLISIAVAVIMVLTLCLSSCGARLVFRDDGYYCSKNGVTYKIIDLQFQPVAIGEKYATLDNIAEDELYEIYGVSPERWLTTKYGDLFCAVDEKIPTFEEINSDKILICKAGDSSIVSLVEINKESSVDYVVNEYINGNTLNYPDTYDISESLMLRFASEEYSWLYYCLSYVEFATDVYEYDYPENIDNYTYRTVGDDVEVTTVNEFECWFAADSNDDVESYEDIAKDAGIDYFTVTKPDGNDTKTFVVFVFQSKDTIEECIEYFIENYDGDMTNDEISAFFNGVEKTEKIIKVAYNYGKYFVYDRFSGRCVMVDDMLHKYRNYQIFD